MVLINILLNTVYITSGIYNLGFNENLLEENTKAFFTTDYLLKHVHIDIMQTQIAREYLRIGAHTFHHWPSSEFLKLFILSPSKCSIAFSVGQKLDIKYINRLTALIMSSPQRVHLHVGSVRMSQWGRKKKPNIKVRNMLRSPIIVINQVCSTVVHAYDGQRLIRFDA